jgi:phosphomethylpyrimidine synthase
MKANHLTQLEMARREIVSEEIVSCARSENVEPEVIRKGVEEGTIVVVRNNRHRTIPPIAIGKGLRTKINTNMGTSKDRADMALELEKVRVSIAAGTDTIMDLSTGAISARSAVPSSAHRRSPWEPFPSTRPPWRL